MKDKPVWSDIEVNRMLTQILILIGNDAYAISFQTMGQYRSGLIKNIAKIAQKVKEK